MKRLRDILGIKEKVDIKRLNRINELQYYELIYHEEDSIIKVFNPYQMIFSHLTPSEFNARYDILLKESLLHNTLQSLTYWHFEDGEYNIVLDNGLQVGLFEDKLCLSSEVMPLFRTKDYKLYFMIKGAVENHDFNIKV